MLFLPLLCSQLYEGNIPIMAFHLSLSPPCPHLPPLPCPHTLCLHTGLLLLLKCSTHMLLPQVLCTGLFRGLEGSFPDDHTIGGLLCSSLCPLPRPSLATLGSSKLITLLSFHQGACPSLTLYCAVFPVFLPFWNVCSLRTAALSWSLVYPPCLAQSSCLTICKI